MTPRRLVVVDVALALALDELGLARARALAPQLADLARRALVVELEDRGLDGAAYALEHLEELPVADPHP